MLKKIGSSEHALIVVGIGTALVLLGDQTLYTVLPSPSIAAQAGVSIAMVGVLLSANRFARLFLNGIAGALFDRLPRRMLMLAAMTAGVISNACYAFGNGPAVMLIGRVLWGAAWSGIWIGGNAMALDISNDANRGSITGRLAMWMSLATAATNFTGGLFTDLFTYRGALLLSTGLGLIGFMIWLLFLPETRRGPTLPAVEPALKAPDKNHFPWKPVLIAAAPLFAVQFSISGVLLSTTILWLSQYIDTGFTIGKLLIPLATLTGVLSGARVLIGTVSAPYIGALTDRYKQRWTVLALVLLTGMLGISLMSTPWLSIALIGTILSALTSRCVPAISAALIGDKVQPERRSRGLGVVLTVSDLGATLGPLIGLALVPVIGIPRVYLICAGLYAVGVVLSTAMALAKPRPEKQPA